MKTLDDKTIEEAEKSPGLFLLLLTTYYCGACQEARKQIKAIEKEEGIPAAEIELYASPKTAMRYMPNGIPTTILLKDGREIRRTKGAADIQKLLLNR